jgi:hypothetical protein
MARTIDPRVRPAIIADLAASLSDPQIRAAWEAMADFCDQAITGERYLVGAGAQLYSQTGAIISFTQAIQGDLTWRNVSDVFSYLYGDIQRATGTPGVLYTTIVIEVYPGFAIALDTTHGPIDQNIGIAKAFTLPDMICAYCLWHVASERGTLQELIDM